MPTIIRDLPFFDRPTTLDVLGHTFSVMRDQIVIWVSLAPQRVQQLDRDNPRFPAVLDTGCNHSFVMHRRHLVEWSGLRPEQLRRLGSAKVYGQLVPQLRANVWLHPNQPGRRDEFLDGLPYLVEMDQGIAVIPDSAGNAIPRLPLLGLRALRWNRLHLVVEGLRRSVSIRTPRRFWLFG